MVRGPGGDFVVPVYFGEHPRGMIVDTGAESNFIYRATLAEEGLHETAEHQGAILFEGATGVERNGIATVPVLKFAGLRFEGVKMVVVGADPPKFDLLPIAGLLGTPYLSAFDVEFDVPGETLSLYGKAGCSAIQPPWQGRYSALPLSTISTNLQQRTRDVESSVNVAVRGTGGEANRARLLVDVQVNGRPERAMLDTGAPTSMRPSAAEKAGLVAVDSSQAITISGADRGKANGDLRHAVELRVGDEVYRDKTVAVVPFVNVEADMILGRDIFRGKRVFISFKERMMFIQPSDSKPTP
jgi:predicted aspartyl protease